jgi:N-acetylmuramoyl-L-alanine amidase
MNQNNFAIIFDNGHGGVINNVYQTDPKLGKMSPDWDKGILYEGLANRWIIAKVIQKMDYARLPYYHISPELEDTSLKQRADRADAIYKSNPNTYGISVHFNAGGGTGWEIYTTPGVNKSDIIGAEFVDVFKSNMPIRARLGGTGKLNEDKEANFYIIRETDCPFILIECAFMDNKSDYDLIWDHKFQDLLAENIFQGILKVNEKYGQGFDVA